MKSLLCALLFCASLGAQSLAFFIHDPTGATPDQPLPSVYQFANTPLGGSSSIVIRVVNSSDAGVTIGAVYVGAAAGSAVANQNFAITGLDQGVGLAPQGSTLFFLNFTPSALAPPPGYMQALEITSESTTIASIATLEGTGTPAQLTLTCTGAPTQCNGNALQPNSPTPFNFGNVASGSVSSITFTFANQSSTAVNTPAVSLQTQQYVSTAFTLDSSALPDAIPPNATASFVLTFEGTEPSGQLASPPQLSATLLVGSNSYQVEGTPIGLGISYVYQTISYTPQGNSIDFGQVDGTATLAFTVTNPPAAEDPASVSVSVSGAGFSLIGAPTTPAIIQPGQSMPTFQLAFSGSQPGSNNGTLTIGTQVFALTATVPQPVGSPGSALSGITLICGTSPCTGQTFTNNQQVNASVQLTSPASVESIFTLAMAFTPSVTGVSDDPAVEFITPIAARSLQMTMPVGSASATYNGNSQLTFQTGTTAGTITFTITYLEQTATLESITIPPAQVQIVSTLAQQQEPNLVVTVNGYDNTYSIDQLSFTFYDTSGGVITSSPIQASVVATDFHQYFFGPNDLGGAFAFEATFPILNGDVTQVGSVAVTVTNSQGTTSATQTFQ